MACRGGEGGDHGLAGADVALHQAQHRFVLGQVVGDLRADPALRAGRLEAEVAGSVSASGWPPASARCLRTHGFAQALQG